MERYNGDLEILSFQWKKDLWGDVPPLNIFFISISVLQVARKIFCQCYQNYFQSKFFRWKLFLWHPKGTPPIDLEVFFSDMLAAACRLNILYGLGNWYRRSSKNCWGIFNTFDVFMISSMYPTFYVILVDAPLTLVKVSKILLTLVKVSKIV